MQPKWRQRSHLTYGCPLITMLLLPIRRILLTGALLLAFAPFAQAWSSQASRTDHSIEQLSITIEVYQAEFGKLPSPERYWMEVRRTGIQLVNGAEPPSDTWGRPLVYRMPGKHGKFDLYSLGADGIDQDGKQDDISNWAGVNDGFHWKATWPAGRWCIAAGIVLGVGTLLLHRSYQWRIVLPLAGFFFCLGVGIGSRLLMHPGVVSSRNIPLRICNASALFLAVVLLVVFVFHMRNKARPESSCD